MTVQSPDSTPNYEQFAKFGIILNRVLQPLSERKRDGALTAIEQMRTYVRDVSDVFGKQCPQVLVIALHEIFLDNGFREKPIVHFKYEDTEGNGDSSEGRYSTSWEDTARDALRDQNDFGRAKSAVDALHGAVNTLRRVDGISIQGAADITVAVLGKELNPRPAPLYSFSARVEPPSLA
ncbi:MAG: hypothetical protein A3F31_03385 [Candidatus Levybacteria bacterium RIFCSPHIGHO2_12_FULL_38_12]|nr:MAG: hypothetical protein A2770_03810 [Candidatus Levybacteria bacterium RIFCSPHIGHO2_01_FULL_38_12]OGH22141.1 MAG: hypothetical protein A3D75_02755 [Candidatus Levybacteria bacterium RIFCSPHIGHO2_02_FULL_37_18]OGH22988.1 MAG: hypothetical protein A3F31_03385 [Candidatus Levybacteria bacterium RIFCSPHIGHO2_12_FULL_38_12]OGH34160.1 MAG: hypothetical protein A3A47_03515 [Candidatus Levybacteria bacterium RIFCSPLOWO2_01_FULL_37_20]OGH44952.1 MAG: hypothetical protein A3J14_01180 [Candidatus Lev